MKKTTIVLSPKLLLRLRNKEKIKEKIDKMKGFEVQYTEHYVMHSLAGFIFSQIVSEDPQLFEEYEKMSADYDGNQMKVKTQARQSQKQQEKKYTYNYYKIIHYDHDLYEMQKEALKKGLRKSKPNGKIECRISESEIPVHIKSKLLSEIVSCCQD